MAKKDDTDKAAQPEKAKALATCGVPGPAGSSCKLEPKHKHAHRDGWRVWDTPAKG